MKPLLLAIAAPNKHAKPALDTLLSTVFINTIDAPSLALIVPVVHRGLRDRSGDAKKKASRIVGNMCALINEPKVFSLTQLQTGAVMYTIQVCLPSHLSQRYRSHLLFIENCHTAQLLYTEDLAVSSGNDVEMHPGL